MFNFMRKDRSEDERAERDRRKSEKREKKKSSKREKPLSPEELERLEEVSRSLKMKGGRKSSDEVDRSNVVGLRYSQFYLPSEPGYPTSPDSQSDTASTWSSSTASLGRPRGILKSKAPGSVSSSKIDLDDEGLLMKNTQQNEINIYKLSPGFSLQTNQDYNQTTGEAQHGEQLGCKSRKLLSNFALRLPVVITVPRTDAWVKSGLPVETWSKVTESLIESFHLAPP